MIDKPTKPKRRFRVAWPTGFWSQFWFTIGLGAVMALFLFCVGMMMDACAERFIYSG